MLDFSVGYLSHRTMHMWPAMWRFHQIHHSDPFVDVTTTYRTHPVETVWRFLFAIVPVWLLGIPAQAVVIQRLLQATNGVIEHANIRLWAPLDRVLSLVWVTPNVHKIHHSREVSETNSNYANLLTLYDRLLGTYTPAERAASVVYGLDEAERPAGRRRFPACCRCRFRHRSAQPSLTQKSGSKPSTAGNMRRGAGADRRRRTQAGAGAGVGARRRSTTTSSSRRPARTASSARTRSCSTWSCST